MLSQYFIKKNTVFRLLKLDFIAKKSTLPTRHGTNKKLYVAFCKSLPLGEIINFCELRCSDVIFYLKQNLLALLCFRVDVPEFLNPLLALKFTTCELVAKQQRLLTTLPHLCKLVFVLRDCCLNILCNYHIYFRITVYRRNVCTCIVMLCSKEIEVLLK